MQKPSKLRFTDLAIKALKPPEKGLTTRWDEALTGFGIRVSQTGTKTFFVMYGTNRQRTTIGRYPVIALSEAREAAKRILATQTLQKHLPRSQGFSNALTAFLENTERRVASKTYSEYARHLNTHWLPTFRHQKLADITTSDIHRKLDRLSNRPSEQDHALVALQVFLNWCIKREYLDTSPAARIDRQSQINSRTRVLSPEELKKVWDACDYYPMGTMVRLLILTGQRKSEIGSLQWDFIEEDTITLPITKNKRQHTFPLSPKVKGIIEAIPQIHETYLFPARGKDNPFNGWSKGKIKLDRLCAVEAWTLHDIRRTFATNLAQMAVQPHIVERILNHATGTISGVAAIYNRFSYMDEMREALSRHERWVYDLAPVG